MKKVLSILVVLCMVFSFASVASAADYSLAINNNVAVMVGNTNAIAYNSIMTMPVAPVEENGVMLAPVSFVTAGFNGTTSKVGNVTVVTLGTERTAYMIEGYNYVVVDGRVYQPEIAPKMVNGELMLPVTFLGETVLGKHVYYDAATKMAVITQRKCLSSRDKEVIATISGAITSGNLPAIVIQAPVAEFTGGGIGGVVAATDTSGELVTAPVGTAVSLSSAMLSASQTPEPANNAANLLDGNTQTAWASQGQATLTINLGSGMTVSTVGVAMKMYEDDRTIPYDVEISSDGASYTQVWSGSSDARTDAMQYIAFSAGAKYVRITAHGNTISGWNSIAEVAVYSTGAASLGTSTGTTTGGNVVAGSVIASPTGTKVALSQSMLNASQTPETDNHAGNLVDGNKTTVWASQGDASVTINLGSAKTVSAVGVAMKIYEDDRTIPYDIEISSNGTSYTQVWTGSSDMMTDATKYVSVGSAAQYVRITAHGNTVSGWNSIAEVEVYSSGAATGVATTTTTTTVTGAAGTELTAATGTKVSLSQSMVQASQTPETDNHAGNVTDGNKTTVWASQGEAFIVVDLGASKNLSCIGVAMKLYEDDRTIPYKIEVSADGSSYTEVWSGNSEMMSDATKYVSTSASARYVRVTAYGNTVSGWNSVAEVEVYTK